MIGRLLLVVLMFGIISGAHAQEMPDSAAQAAMMAKSMELAQPGEEHKLLEKLAGDWNYEATMWVSPGAEPIVFPGTSSAKMVLGGRFLYGEFFTDAAEMSGEGLYILGFDRRHEKFTYVGFDTWGTYWVTADGTYDEKTNSITMYGEDDDPVMGITQKYDFVITFNPDDTWKFEVIFLDEAHTKGADKFKMVEVNYIRAE